MSTHEQGAAVSENCLAEGLRPMMSEERLAANAQRYDVMRVELSERERRQVDAIKSRLIQMPLVHGTRDPDAYGQIQREGLKPYSEREGQGGSSYPFDDSLRLTEYVFMTWGQLPQPGADNYGSSCVILDGSVLLGNVVVTPEDITRAAPLGVDLKHHSYADLSDEVKDAVEREYFDYMVTGRDWLEITARKVLQFATEHPDLPYPVSEFNDTTLGEIKHLGTIAPEHVLENITLPNDPTARRASLTAWRERMLQHGVMIGATIGTLEIQPEIRKYDPDPEAAERFRRGDWRDILAIE